MLPPSLVRLDADSARGALPVRHAFGAVGASPAQLAQARVRLVWKKRKEERMRRDLLPSARPAVKKKQ